MVSLALIASFSLRLGMRGNRFLVALLRRNSSGVREWFQRRRNWRKIIIGIPLEYRKTNSYCVHAIISQANETARRLHDWKEEI